MWIVTVLTLGLAILGYANARELSLKGPREQNELKSRPNPPPLVSSSRNIDCVSTANQVTLHPHPTNCSLFLQCVHGLPVERPCAPGTEFSAYIGVCVHPWQSNCTAGIQPVPEQDDESETEIPDEENEKDSETQVDCSSSINQGTLHPHSTSCTLYLQCVHGVSIERSCPLGTEFSPYIGVCVHSWQSDCTRKQPVTEPESVTAEDCDSEAGDLPNEENPEGSGDLDTPEKIDESEEPQKADQAISEEFNTTAIRPNRNNDQKGNQKSKNVTDDSPLNYF